MRVKTREGIAEALRQAQVSLQKISDAPRLDAERLLLFVLRKKEASWLYAHGEEELSEGQQREFERLVAERATGKPLAYILGEWEFYGRPFYVTPDVLVPRPATEELLEKALAHIQDDMVVADIGTGSGVIAVTLALETQTPSSSPLSGGAQEKNSSLDKGRMGGVSFIATDISPAALKVAKKNAQRHGVERMIEFLQGDMLTPLHDRKIDLIISNPPYLPAETLAEAGWTVNTVGLQFEPRAALDGGPDGQRFARQIAAANIPAWVETTGGVTRSFSQ